jgi:hypothetical protein
MPSLCYCILPDPLTNSTEQSAFTFFPEDRSRHYDFVDTPVNWRPSSPLIDRQHLTPVDQVQLRHACKVLCEMIARGEIPPPLPPSGRSFSERKAASEHDVREPSYPVPSEPVERHGQYVSEETNEDGPAERRLYDSGIIIEEETGSAESPKDGELAKESDEGKTAAPENGCNDSPQNTAGVGLAQFYPDESDDLVLSVPDKAPFTSDGDQSIGHYHPRDLTDMLESPVIPVIGSFEPTDYQFRFDEQGEADDEYFTKGMFVGPESEVPGVDSPSSPIRPTTGAETDALKSRNVHPLRDMAAASLPDRTPSFSRPRSSLGRPVSRRVPRSHDNMPPLPQETREVSPGRFGVYQHRSQPSWETRQGVAGEHALGGVGVVNGARMNNKSVAVVIDTDGTEHVMTASEEKRRYLDLQQAVMEKMFTGAIGNEPEISISYGSGDGYLSAKRATSRPSSVRNSHQRSNSGTYLTPSRSRHARGNVGEIHTHPSSLNNSQERKPSIMRKLSVLALGKRKPSNVAKDVNMAGFSRVVEAS